MTELETAWLAGLFDGEGSVWSRWPKRANLQVEIKMTDRRTVERVNELFPGRFSQGTLSKLSFGWRPQWRWALDTDRAVRFLCAVGPYLITKKQAAIIGVELVSRNGSGRLDLVERQRRDELATALRATY